MKRWLTAFALATVAHAQQLLAPAPTVTITLHVCNPFQETPECYGKLAAWNRAHDLSELMPLLTQDFKNLGAGQIDIRLRQHITVILKRLEKEDQ